MKGVKRELVFLLALWKANLLASMEFRSMFISQVVFMFLNDAAYFVFWVLFFDRFQSVRGWELVDMFVLFGVVASGFGLSTFLFGGVMTLSEVIATGRLDYYLSLPRPVLVHTLASSSNVSGLGDLLYGIMSFIAAGYFSPALVLRFLVALVLSVIIFLSFLVIVQSLAFWLGSAQMLSEQANNAMLTFSIYPITLFDGYARLLLFTLMPAALVGAVPVEFIRDFTWTRFGMLVGAALGFSLLAGCLFRRGLRRYESGSAIQVRL